MHCRKVLSLATPSGILPTISAALGVGVALLIYLTGFQNPFDRQEIIRSEWKALRKEAEAEAQAAVASVGAGEEKMGRRRRKRIQLEKVSRWIWQEEK